MNQKYLYKKREALLPFFYNRNCSYYPIFSKIRPAAFFAGTQPATIAIKTTNPMTAK